MQFRLVAALLAAALAVPALAQDARHDAEDPIVRELAVAYYARRHDVDPERARQRLEIQDRAAGLEDALARLLGEQYAGIWYDADDEGRLKIGVTRGAVARTDAIMRLVDDYALGRDADLVPVHRSELELTRLQNAVRHETRELVDSARASTGYDTRANSVVVRAVERLPDRDEAMLRRLQDTPGVSVRRVDARTLAGRLDTCNITYCDPPLRGGRQITGLGGCTAAFMSRERNGSNLWAVTAGHCLYFNALFGGGYAWSARDETKTPSLIGFYANYRFGAPDGRDAGILWITPGGAWSSPTPIAAVVVKASDETTYNPAYPIRATSRSSIGQTLCRTGATTGTECGEVSLLGADESAKGPDGYYYQAHNMGEVDVCASNGGDSGGPWYKRNRAFGIHSGAVDAGPAFCWEFYQGIRDAENLLGVDVMLAP